MPILNLETPDQQAPGTTTYEVDWVLLDFKGNRVSVKLVGQHGEQKGFEFVGALGAAVVNALATANFTTRSMDDAILRRLVTEGLISGTVV